MQDREAWLAERRTGIGGSDAAAAVGMSKWKTRLELYLDKRGELETPENEAMHWGTVLEPVVRQEYSNRTGNAVTVPNRILRHPTVPFAIVNVDGIVEHGEGRLYEGKTARTAEGWGEPGSGDVPMEYRLQVEHAMFVTGLTVADIAVLIGGSDFRIYTVERDAELQSLLIEQEAEFWRHVQEGIPPAPVSREDIKRRWRVSSGESVTVTDDALVTAKRLANFKALDKAAEDAIDQLTGELQLLMGDAAEMYAGGELLATWKNINASPRFDLERFKAEQPDLWKQYLSQPEPQRRFLLKVKGQTPCLPHLLPTAALTAH